ncbi:MAG: YicC family protein [Clostridia bacterium]|nr:YicC family protein [Clostridia bacterium]
MIKSMTGYGRGIQEINGREYTVEIKAVNHRYNDISIRMPRYLNFLEDKLRQYVSKSISRGKIDIYVTLNNLSSEGRSVKIDKELAGIYVAEMQKLVEEFHIENDITATSLIRLPDVIISGNEENDKYWEELKLTTDIALSNIIEARTKEGEHLKSDIEARLNTLEENVSKVEERSSTLLDEYRQKLENRVNELKANDIIDENRIGIEIVLFADKCSICEEITRLRSHIKSFRGMLEADGPIGKKIDFLVQEMNREINTIGSKANCLDITNSVIDMKNEVENIREQIQNIE